MALNPYETLGVPIDADAKTIRDAYKRKAQVQHPDKNPDDPHAVTRFQLLGEARDILLDADRRARYDRGDDPRRMNTIAKAREVIGETFKAELKARGSDNIIHRIRKQLEQMEANAHANKRSGQESNAALDSAKLQFDFDGDGQNMLAAILDAQIAENNSLLKQIDETIDALRLAQEMLSEYTDRSISNVFTSQHVVFTSSTGATGG